MEELGPSFRRTIEAVKALRNRSQLYQAERDRLLEGEQSTDDGETTEGDSSSTDEGLVDRMITRVSAEKGTLSGS